MSEYTLNTVGKKNKLKDEPSEVRVILAKHTTTVSVQEVTALIIVCWIKDVLK